MVGDRRRRERAAVAVAEMPWWWCMVSNDRRRLRERDGDISYQHYCNLWKRGGDAIEWIAGWISQVMLLVINWSNRCISLSLKFERDGRWEEMVQPQTQNSLLLFCTYVHYITLMSFFLFPLVLYVKGKVQSEYYFALKVGHIRYCIFRSVWVIKCT